MVRPIHKTYAPSNVSTTYFAASVSGASFALTNTTTPDNLAHQPTITGLSATDLSGINFTITGIDQDGNVQTETKALPNGTATVTASLFYKSISSVVPASTTGAAAVSIGYNNQFSSQTFPLEVRGSLLYVDVVVSGTINYSIQYTGDDIQGKDKPPFNWLEDDGTAVVNSNVNGSATFTSIPMGMRLLINSYSSGATAKLTISQMNPGS